jgi:signal transduction histidine kinase
MNQQLNKTNSNLIATAVLLHQAEDRLTVATEALRKSEERVIAGQLALEVMHEIRNPLETLGNLIYLARQNADNAGGVRYYISLAEEQMSTVSNICNYTLGFAQTSSRPKPIDLGLLTEAAVRIHQRKIEEKNIHLVKDIPEAVLAEVYAGEILQVLSNFITNALDALPKDGILRLRLRKRARDVEFVIADNGHGIQPHYTESIFKPFFTTKGERGTGLGLALSKRIIDRHRGWIRVRSSVRGGKAGTAFKISLPITQLPSTLN